ncbi:hypothetical protein KM043_006846 [Ampulex compressa]|nr:hypothetical protein KM043_006846 [Ampulex compressa]
MQSIHAHQNVCSCPPISLSPCPPTSVPRTQTPSTSSKYYQEIGAEMIGNRLIIRIEKDKNKARKKREQWDPPCDCDTVEIRRPTKSEGPRIINANNENAILFRIHSKSRLDAKDDPNYKPQAIAYNVGSCKGGQSTNDQCRTITIHPQLGGSGTQEVHTDHVTEENQSVFFLRVKRKPDSADRKKRNIELELRTPKPPAMPAIESQLESRSTTKLTVDTDQRAQVDQKVDKSSVNDIKEKKKRRKK